MRFGLYYSSSLCTEIFENGVRLIWIIRTLQVKASLSSSDGRVLEKNDQTPVTVADFGVQALISLGNKESQI